MSCSLKDMNHEVSTSVRLKCTHSLHYWLKLVVNSINPDQHQPTHLTKEKKTVYPTPTFFQTNLILVTSPPAPNNHHQPDIFFLIALLCKIDEMKMDVTRIKCNDPSASILNITEPIYKSFRRSFVRIKCQMQL